MTTTVHYNSKQNVIKGRNFLIPVVFCLRIVIGTASAVAFDCIQTSFLTHHHHFSWLKSSSKALECHGDSLELTPPTSLIMQSIDWGHLLVSILSTL